MSDDVLNLVAQWKSLSEGDLDREILRFINEHNQDYIYCYESVLYWIYIKEPELRGRIKASFARLAPFFLDNNTRAAVEELAKMSEPEIREKLLKIYHECGKGEIDKIYIFAKDQETRSKIDKVLLELSPKFKHDRLLREIEKWESISDDDLLEEVAKKLLGSGWDSSSSHFTFVIELYPSIDNALLRQRVDNVLLSLAETSQLDPISMEKCGRAIYASARLKIPGARKKLGEIVHQITDPSDISYSSLIAWVNRALEDCEIQEAEEYLVKQLESLPENWSELITSPKLDYSQRAHYMTLLTAYEPLLRLNKNLADSIARKVKLKG